MRFCLLFFALLLSTVVHATPNTSGDEVTRLLSERGLLDRIGEVGTRVETKASELVVTAMGFLGVPYKRGGNSLETGIDCSGFVRAIYEQTAGLILPRKAEQQAAATQKSTGPNCNQVTWFSSTPCAGHSAMWAFMSEMANSSTRPNQVPRFAWKTWESPTGTAVLMAHAVSVWIPMLPPQRSPDPKTGLSLACSLQNWA